jgi:altronate dehydratase small subunit
VILLKFDALLINSKDNVATALREINENEKIIVGENKKTINLIVVEKISFGHKVAIKDIKKGDDIVKYGEVIGKATQDIPSGHYAHVHNIESLRGRGDLERK